MRLTNFILKQYGLLGTPPDDPVQSKIIPAVSEAVPRRGDFHGVGAYSVFHGQALLRESISSNDQEKLKELTKIMVKKVINNEIPIISLMANYIEDPTIREYLVVQSTQGGTETLMGDKESVTFGIGNDGDISTLHTLDTNEVQDYWRSHIERRIGAFVSNNYSGFNTPKSEKYIMGHNHPDGLEPSNTDLRLGGQALSLVLTQNSVYFIKYNSELQDLAKLQASFMERNKALTSACLETQQEASAEKTEDVKQQEGNSSRIQYASRLLSCNIDTYQHNSSPVSFLRPFNPLQIELITKSIELSYNKENDLLKASMRKILNTPEALQVFGNALELYSEQMSNNSESDFKKILKEALVEVFNAQAIFQLDRLNNNPEKINSEILTNLPRPRELAAALVSGDINSFLRSTLLDAHSDFRYTHETDEAYYDSLKEKFGISVARIPLKEILDEEDYTQFQYKKAGFVRDLFLNDYYSKYNKAREFWRDSFVPLNINEGIKAMNLFDDNHSSSWELLAEKTVKVLGADDIEGLITAYQGLDNDEQKIFFLSALWKESHSIVDKLNEVVSNEDLNNFNNNLHGLCQRDCVKDYIDTFGARLDFDTSHLRQISYIAQNYQEEGFAIDLINSIGKSIKKKESPIDENLYNFFVSDSISDQYKKRLAELLPLQEKENQYYAKLSKISTESKISFEVREILRHKLKSSTPSGTSSSSGDSLAEIISEFNLIATSKTAINPQTIKRLAILAPQYLLTEFPRRLFNEISQKDKYSSDLISRLQKIDPIYFDTQDFQLIKNAFLKYLNKNKAQCEADIERFKANSILEAMKKKELNKITSQIDFFENPTNS